MNTKISEVENKIPNHNKCITTPDFNKLTAKSFTVWLKQANLVTSGGSWSFDNGTARNVIIFDGYSSSSSHVDNRKNNFLILVLGPIYGINGKSGSADKRFGINFTKSNIKFCLSLHYIMMIIVMSVNGKEIVKFKANSKNVNFPTQFCLGSISDGFNATESREVSLNGNVYDFSVDYNSIDKSDILNIHKYLMTKNNIK